MTQNNFGIHKLWNFGKSLRQKYKTWQDLVFDDEWDDFCDRHFITSDQQNFIKQGYHGEKITARTDGIFPFGVHKGKPLNQVPIQYLVWCSEQEWLHKWPVVQEYCKIKEKEIQRYVKDSEEGMKELKSILQ